MDKQTNLIFYVIKTKRVENRSATHISSDKETKSNLLLCRDAWEGSPFQKHEQRDSFFVIIYIHSIETIWPSTE